MLGEQKSALFPSKLVTEQCDAPGNLYKLNKNMIGIPNYELCHLRHHTYKTVEEFALKMIRGDSASNKYDFDDIMRYFARINVLTEEKLKVIEHIANRTFPQ